ncbi:hypothetical protein Efla_002171 [Eimeria flavescens]
MPVEEKEEEGEEEGPQEEQQAVQRELRLRLLGFHGGGPSAAAISRGAPILCAHVGEGAARTVGVSRRGENEKRNPRTAFQLNAGAAQQQQQQRLLLLLLLHAGASDVAICISTCCWQQPLCLCLLQQMEEA